MKAGNTEFSSTFVFGNEDHTLGNCLRHVLCQRKETEFVGYSVPHPYEPKMNIRLQTRTDKAINVLKAGLNDLEEATNIIDDSFIQAMRKYRK